MAVRLNGLCTGGSGAAPAVAETLASMLNAAIHPVVPRYGSIGAADLCLLAHVGLVVGGEGEADVAGRRVPGGQALADAGIAPVALRSKDGLALCERLVGVGGGRSAGADPWARRMLEWLQSAAALSMEGFQANLEPDRPTGLRRAAGSGQEWAARGLRERLAGSSLTEPGAARRLQDPLSFRCAAVIHGALHAALGFLEAGRRAGAERCLRQPARARGGRRNPPHRELPHGRPCTRADAVAIAIAQSAAPSAERISRLCTTELSGLPANLSPDGSTGMAPLQKVAHALVTAIRQRAAPLAVHPSVDAGSVEDDAPNAALATLRLEDQLDLFRRLIALELVCAAQAMDLARPPQLGAGTAAVHEKVRELAEPLTDARPLTADIEAVAAMVLR